MQYAFLLKTKGRENAAVAAADVTAAAPGVSLIDFSILL